MSGNAKPNVPNLQKESNFTLLGGIGSQGSNPQGLFNGVVVNEWNTVNVMYWQSSTQFVEISVDSDFSIWRCGTNTWANSIGKLQVLYWRNNSYVDISNEITQTVTPKLLNGWEITIPNLKAGRYKFVGTTPRIDSEWYLESKTLNKFLVFNQSKYKTWNNTTMKWEDLITTTVNSEDFLNFGMNSLVPELNSREFVNKIIVNTSKEVLSGGTIFNFDLNLSDFKNLSKIVGDIK